MSILLAKPVFGRVDDGNVKRTDVKAYEKKGRFWLGLSHNYERGRVFKSVGGGGTDSGPSKFWKYKKTNASFLSEDQETGKRIGLN